MLAYIIYAELCIILQPFSFAYKVGKLETLFMGKVEY